MKKNTKKTETTIAAEVIAREIIQNAKPPSAKAIMQRITSLTAAAVKNGPEAFGYALRQIDNAARAYWKAGHTEGRAIMYRVSTLCTAAAKHGPQSFRHALNEIEAATRNFWKKAHA